MKSTWLLLTLASAMAASATVPAQRLNPSARDILNADRPLQPAEIAIVLAAAREAISGKTCRLSYQPNGPGPELLMGTDGRPRFMRAVSGYNEGAGSVQFDGNGNGILSPPGRHVEVVTFTEYTRRAAIKCDGTPLRDELVIEYEHKSTDERWTAKTRTRNRMEVLAPVFNMLTGTTPVESGSRRSFGDRVGRALAAPWELPAGAQPGGPLPAGVTQSLWIDTVSMLPLRWSLSMPAMPERGVPAIPDYGMSFTYDASLDLQPPDAVLATDCVR